MKAKKIRAGKYKYRGYFITREEFSGPEGGERKCWSIGDPETGYAHERNPQLDTMRAARAWVDAWHDNRAECGRIERDNEPRAWGD